MFLKAALLGNYETSGVYYQGVVQQIHRLLATITDPVHKGKWQSVISLINIHTATDFLMTIGIAGSAAVGSRV